METPHWYLDELDHAGAEHLDPDYVGRYDRKAGFDPADDLALLRHLGLDESRTLVDLGTGTGAMPLIAAPYCRRVVAVDVSSAMLDVLRERAKRAGLGNIECVRAGFLTYRHAGEPADIVYSRHALHHLPDFWKALAVRRVAAMLRPGGVFHVRDLIFSSDLDGIETTIERWLSHAAETTEIGWTRSELEAHLRGEHSTFSWLLEPMLSRAGFRIQQTHDADSTISRGYTCIRQPSAE